MTDFSTLEQINASSKNTMMEVLGIRYTELGEDFICGTMPVDNRTHQPMGILHGGASAALIETLGSIGSHLLIDRETEFSSGLDLNINHIRSMKSGIVTGKATIIHKGRKTHVWQVNLTNEENKLVATGRLTVYISKK
ncbi:PaaI family thioesterase [Flavobacteriales bacterium]|nr:PaaI family thioesterase [Flavobacteriales bacterium]MDB4088463.1 PaaI family thioesterase [Flavobacteriales bacterium]